MGLPDDLKPKIKVPSANGVKLVMNPLFAKENFKRGTIYYRHSADGILIFAVWKDNRVLIFKVVTQLGSFEIKSQF